MSNLELAIVATISKNVQQNRKCKYKYKYEFLQICLILSWQLKQQFPKMFNKIKNANTNIRIFTNMSNLEAAIQAKIFFQRQHLSYEKGFRM